MNEEQLHNIEIDIKQAQKALDLQKDLRKLTQIPEFKRVIEEGYFTLEPSRLVLLKADPALQSEQDQVNINNSINAIGHFRQYLIAINRIAAMMEKSMAANESAKEEILADDDDLETAAVS